jgi:hypothetical protein
MGKQLVEHRSHVMRPHVRLRAFGALSYQKPRSIKSAGFLVGYTKLAYTPGDLFKWKDGIGVAC